MKLQYSKILLFSLPLNILVSSSYAHNKNKSYIAPHIPTTTTRVLSECNLYIPKYDNDADMKSVKENFDRQTSQRFEEYEERMIKNRQKRKEQRDKNIQKIIHKDKMEKNLAEKVEIGCLRCGCALGGVAASVGLFGGLGTYGWKIAATATAMELAKEAAEQAGAAAAADAGKNAVIAGLKELGVQNIAGQPLVSYLTATNYHNATFISSAINNQYSPSSCIFVSSGTRSGPVARETFCTWVMQKSTAAANVQRSSVSFNDLIIKTIENIVTDAKKAAGEATEKAIEEVIQRSTAAVESTYASCQSAIIASVVAIVVIALVMIIIYLVLRYRRKKKMNKKAQYTELLNQ
ncbi:rifin [Plasmodium falciparum NF54]|uniref:Rifin n=2 Tax=Plasmodium falciparum TaxID=5833 RepID=Q8IJ05_PLAF7|nr:rifin [Plasmodium falciparum 3D7]KAF4330840.1 rifin [Plasmodium falciparum NF54]PKC43376.1 rifin [Plasmodium falciparum NF54]CZT98659.1 rifin [Plasmodium falciparum 3D7]|eukprot:XP_001347681.1 rifin [Plasmodium falciparum 3D7]